MTEQYSSSWSHQPVLREGCHILCTEAQCRPKAADAMGKLSTMGWCQHHCRRPSDFVGDIVQLGKGEEEMGKKHPCTFPPTLTSIIFTSSREKSDVPLVAARTTSSSSCSLEAFPALCPDALQVPLKPKWALRQGCLPTSTLENTTWNGKPTQAAVHNFFFLFFF